MHTYDVHQKKVAQGPGPVMNNEFDELPEATAYDLQVFLKRF